jgi:raffinose/stachyose/melibiose transport system substrate-binding protein
VENVTRRTVLAGGLSVAAVGFLAACSTGAGSNKTIVFWENLTNSTQVGYFKKNFVDAYKKFPVQFINKPNNAIDRLIQTSLAAGSGPSVVITPGPSSGVPDYSKAGYLVDLSKYIQKYNWDNVFAPWALDASKINGKLMSLPTEYETMAFYTNPDTISKKGLTVPKTQAEFEEFCTEAKAKGMVPIATGNAEYQGVNEWHAVIALNHGAGPQAVYSALTGKTKWTDPVFVDAIQRYTDYFKKGWFGGGVQAYFTNTFASVYKQLQSGKAAAMMSGTWEFAELPPYFGKVAGNTSTWDWTTLPSLGHGVPEVVWDLAIGQSAAVNSKAANVAGSVDYLNFLTTNKRAIVNAVKDQDFEPSPIHLAASDFPAGTDKRIVRLYSELSAAKSIGYTTWTFFPQKTESYIILYWEQVLTGKITAAEYCAGIQAAFAKELAAGAVPPAPKPGKGF